MLHLKPADEPAPAKTYDPVKLQELATAIAAGVWANSDPGSLDTAAVAAKSIEIAKGILDQTTV